MLDQTLDKVRIRDKLVLDKGVTVIATSSTGVQSSISMAELANLDGVTATATEINRTCDVSTRVVSTTASTLTVTEASHDGKVIVLASTHTQTVTLPQATGSGGKYSFFVSTTGTDGSKVIKVANATDVMAGVSVVSSTATDQVSSFLTSATSDTITLNNTTTGGILGTSVEIIDVATGVFKVEVQQAASGTVATPFSAAVS